MQQEVHRIHSKQGWHCQTTTVEKSWGPVSQRVPESYKYFQPKPTAWGLCCAHPATSRLSHFEWLHWQTSWKKIDRTGKQIQSILDVINAQKIRTPYLRSVKHSRLDKCVEHACWTCKAWPVTMTSVQKIFLSSHCARWHQTGSCARISWVLLAQWVRGTIIDVRPFIDASSVLLIKGSFQKISPLKVYYIRHWSKSLSPTPVNQGRCHLGTTLQQPAG